MISLFKNHWHSLLLFILLIIGVQIIGNVTTFSSVRTWYAELEKPFWNPPNWVFGPVWTLLYCMLAVFGWRIWIHFPGSWRTKFQQPAIRFYFLQLFFNALWSPLFFGLQLLIPAFIAILMMIVFTGLLFVQTRRFDKTLAWWLVPYIAWLCYAASLNGAIIVLN